MHFVYLLKQLVIFTDVGKLVCMCVCVCVCDYTQKPTY